MFTPLHPAATCTNVYTGGDYCCAAAEEHAHVCGVTLCECCGAVTTGNDKDGFLCSDETCPAAIEWRAINDDCSAD